MSEDPRPRAANPARRRITLLIVLAVVVAALACGAYSIRDRFYFGTDPRTLSQMYVSSYAGGGGDCKLFPLYRFDLDASLLWDGTCAMTPGGITIDPTGKSSAAEEGFTQWRPLSPTQVDDLRAAVRQAHADVWKPRYGSNEGCGDFGGWTLRFVYTNGDSEATTVEDCRGGTPPRADILWSAIDAIT